MYSDKLYTPHHENADSENDRYLLVASPKISEIGRQFAESDATYADVRDVSLSMAKLVSNTLRYERMSPDNPAMSEQQVAAQQTTGCYGYTIVLSELLDSADVSHYVGFANRHAFIVAGTDSEGLYLADPLSPHLSGDVTGAISGPPIDNQLQEGVDFASVFLKTDRLIEASSSLDDVRSAAAKHPWLMFGKDPMLIAGGDVLNPHDTRLVMNLYKSQRGRQVLEDYSGFISAMSKGDLASASARLFALDGVFPDIDVRNKFEAVADLALQLGRQGMRGDAVRVLESVERSLVRSEHPDVRTWKADRLRKLGAAVADASILKESLSIYESLWPDVNPRKIAKARKLLKDLGKK